MVKEQGRVDHEGYIRHRQVIDSGALVAQSYNVFRYIMACQSRGRIQAKFNGGLFTQPLRYGGKPRMVATQVDDKTWISHEDDRLLRRRFTYQNQRLLYWPLLMSGDGDLLKPFFDYYWDLLPIRKAITRSWFGHEGAYYVWTLDELEAVLVAEDGIELLTYYPRDLESLTIPL